MLEFLLPDTQRGVHFRAVLDADDEYWNVRAARSDAGVLLVPAMRDVWRAGRNTAHQPLREREREKRERREREREREREM